jgi:hypothetical protein
MRCMPMRCMNREIFDLSLSIPRRTLGQGGVGPSVKMGYRIHAFNEMGPRLQSENILKSIPFLKQF